MLQRSSFSRRVSRPSPGENHDSSLPRGAGYDFAPWPALPPCGSLSYDTHPGRKWDRSGACAWITLLPAVPFLPSSPCLPCPESALPWIRKRCWVKGPAASKPSPHMAGFLGCAFTDLQWLPIFSKGLLSRGMGRGFLWPFRFPQVPPLCIRNSPKSGLRQFPWVSAALSCTQKDLDHWLVTEHLPG